MICSEPQTPAAMLISPNGESFGSKLHATTVKMKRLIRRAFFICRPRFQVLDWFFEPRRP